MGRFIDKTGLRFGDLVVICEAPKGPKNQTRWVCRCECGNEKIVASGNLPATKSCGCKRFTGFAARNAAAEIDRTGERVGRLVIVRPSETRMYGRKSYLCVCDCGNEIVVPGSSVREGKTTSCGCLQSEKTAEANAARAKHGHARQGKENRRQTTPEYRSWKAMLERIRNLNAPNYHLYGGRGITICERWQGENGFNNFLSDMGERPEGMTLDRINNDGNYEPSNCRWADAKRQSNNRRNTPALRAARERNLKGGRKRWPRKPK